MNQPDADLTEKARRVVVVQLLVTTGVAVVFFVVGAGLFGMSTEKEPAWGALSAAYGGLASIILALISIRGFRRANVFALSDPKKSMMILYIAAVVRFMAVIVVLGIGLGLLKLEPMAVFIGFVLAQASYLMGVRDHKAARNPD